MLVVNLNLNLLLVEVLDVSPSSSFVNILSEIAMLNKIFYLSQLVVFSVMAMSIVEATVLAFLAGGQRLHRIWPSQILLSFYLHRNFRPRGKERSIVIEFISRVLQLGTLSMGRFGLLRLDSARFFLDLLLPRLPIGLSE